MNITLALLKNEIANLEFLLAEQSKKHGNSGEQARNRAITETYDHIQRLTNQLTAGKKSATFGYNVDALARSGINPDLSLKAND